MLNLSFVIDSLSPGGAEKITVDLINRINRNRFNITLYSLFNSAKLKNNIINKVSPEITFIELDIEKLPFWKRFPYIRKTLRNSDIVHTCLDMSNFYIPLSMFFRRKTKVVVSVHGRTAVFIDDPALKVELGKRENRKYVLITKYLQRIANLRIDKFIALSEETRGFLIDSNGINPEKIKVHYYGYDYGYLKKSSLDEIRETRKELGFAPDAFIISFIGRLSYAKGILEFVGIIPYLINILKDIRFLIVGDGVLKDELDEMISRLNIRNFVRMTGHSDNIGKYFSVTDLMVLPSFSECFPLVIEEAMYLRVPVVCSDVGGIPEIVKDASTGYLFAKGDFNSLKSILLRLYKDKKNLEMIAGNAYSLVNEKFDLNRNVKGFEQIVLGLSE